MFLRPDPDQNLITVDSWATRLTPPKIIKICSNLFEKAIGKKQTDKRTGPKTQPPFSAGV